MDIAQNGPSGAVIVVQGISCPTSGMTMTLALHAYSPTEPGCLPFRRGDILLVFNRDPSGWWDGVCNGQRGWFPSEYVGSAPEAVAQKALSDLAAIENDASGVNTDQNMPMAKTPGDSEMNALSASLPAGWKAVRTTDGRIFYHNTTTDATTWSLEEVRILNEGGTIGGDVAGGMRPRLPTLTGQPHQAERVVRYGTGKAAPNLTIHTGMAGSLRQGYTSPDKVHQGRVVGEPGPPESTFDSLVSGIIQPISELAVAGSNSKPRFARLTNEVSRSCRLLFAYCGILNESSVVLLENPVLLEQRREVVAALNQLALAARVALGVWPPSDAVHHLRRQAMTVLQSIKRFVKLTEEFPMSFDEEALLLEKAKLPAEGQPKSPLSPSQPVARGSTEGNLPFLGETSAKAREEAFVAQLDDYRRIVSRVGGELLRRLNLEIQAEVQRAQGQGDLIPEGQQLTADALLLGVKDTVNKTGQLLSFLEDLRAPDDLFTPEADAESGDDGEDSPVRVIRKSLEDPLQEFGMRRDVLYMLLNDLLNSARMAVGGALPPTNFIQGIYNTARDVLQCADAVIDCAKVVVRRRELVEMLLVKNAVAKAGAGMSPTTDLLALRRKTRSLQQMATRAQQSGVPSESVRGPGMRRTTMQSTTHPPSAVQQLAHGHSPLPLAGASSTGMLPIQQPVAVPALRKPYPSTLGVHAETGEPGMMRSASAGVYPPHPESSEPLAAGPFAKGAAEFPTLPQTTAALQSPTTTVSYPGTPRGPSIVRFFDGQQAPSGKVAAAAKESDNASPWYLGYDYQPDDIMFNIENNVIGATFEALVERLTLHDTAIDSEFVAVFMQTFRCYSTPQRFLECLIERYSREPPEGLSTEQLATWRQRKQMPIRLRVFNMLKSWLESYFFDGVDDAAIPVLIEFAQKGAISEAMPSNAARLADMIQNRHNRPAPMQTAARASMTRISRSKSIDRLLFVSTSSSPSNEPPASIVSRQQLNNLRQKTANVVDLDALEVARQITLIDSKVYCSIKVFELVGQEFMNKESAVAVNVKAMSTLSNGITTWVAESILKDADPKKRAVVVKFFIKVAEKLLSLNNFKSLVDILCAINSSTIDRLRKTWNYVPARSKTLLNELRKAVEHSRNYAEYRARLKATDPPCVPFFGLYLTDLVFTDDGNPNFRRPPGFVPGQPETKQLVNFDKYVKTVRIIQDMQRFQRPYILADVPEMQEWLKERFESSITGGDPDALYRLSLKVEPREDGSSGPTAQPRAPSPVQDDIDGGNEVTTPVEETLQSPLSVAGAELTPDAS